MKLRGIDFGPVWLASGTQGFFGEGYWFHHLSLGRALDEATFVAKTVTLNKNKGYMALTDAWQPYALFPYCIKTNFFKGITLNAVGLSNYGIEAALETNKWQSRTKPFMLSFMPVSKTKSERLGETKNYVRHLRPHLQTFASLIALQVNLSCPNTGENLKELETEAVEILSILRELNVPLIPKFNVLTSPQTVKRISEETHIDAVCISNTIPYNQLPEKINWDKMFGKVSPLHELGGGGLSGTPLFPLVKRWVYSARMKGLELPINAGGGIMHAHQVDELFIAGANSISIGTVALLRPWRVGSIIERAHTLKKS